MKHVLSALALAAAVIGSAAGPAFAGDVQDFTIHNLTGMQFSELYVEAMSHTDTWGENLLSSPMGEGETKVTFSGKEQECKYGIKVVTADGKSWEVMDVDLCPVSNFGLGVQDGKVVYAHD